MLELLKETTCPREPLRNQGLASTCDIGHGVESRRTSRQYQPSRFAREKTVSPRSSQSLKLKDKVTKADSLIRPPRADLPLNFVKSASSGYIIQEKNSGTQSQPDKVRKSESNDDELIRYMSKVPKYLQKADKLQCNVLNFGVLDWGRLEKWTQNHSNGSACSTSRTDPSVPLTVSKIDTFDCQAWNANNSYIESAHKTNLCPIVRPLKGRATNFPKVGSYLNTSSYKESANNKKAEAHARSIDLKSARGQQKDMKLEKHKENKNLVTDAANLKSAKGKEKYSNQDSTHVTKISSSDLDKDAEPSLWSEQFERLGLDNSDQHSCCKQENIVLILPKDFSTPCTSELPPKVVPPKKSAQHNWGSFSDIFSIDEISLDDSLFDLQQSCSLNHAIDTEIELDVELNDIVEAQSIQLPVDPKDIPTERDLIASRAAGNTSSVPMASSGAKAQGISEEMNRDSLRHQRFGFSIGKMTRSLSFQEGSTQPPNCSTLLTAKSGPAKSEDPAACGTSDRWKENVNTKGKASQLRRLLDPLLNLKVTKQMKELQDELIVKPFVPAEVNLSERYPASAIKALLHLTVKSGLPLFKFVVETNNEILASTVKSLSTFGKTENSWLYTFYAVHKVWKKTGRWKTQKVKPCELGYNIVGQMKMSKPYIQSSRIPESSEKVKLKEAVLCSIGASNSGRTTSEFMTGRELAAIIMKMPNETENKCGPDSGFYEFEDQNFPRTVVILPGADHSLPHEGIPSSLINRWRSGGLCDCGGWDEGCKLRVLNEMDQDHKNLANLGSMLMNIQFDLYDQGEPEQNTPYFRLIPFRDGLFSVEFDAKMSSLQAFAICVAVINRKESALALDECNATYYAASKQDLGKMRAPVISGEYPEILTPHPPLSPAGRV